MLSYYYYYYYYRCEIKQCDAYRCYRCINAEKSLLSPLVVVARKHDDMVTSDIDKNLRGPKFYRQGVPPVLWQTTLILFYHSDSNWFGAF